MWIGLATEITQVTSLSHFKKTLLLSSYLLEHTLVHVCLLQYELFLGPQIESMPEYVLSACRDQDVACTLVIYYCMHVMRQKDSGATCRLLRLLANCANDIVYQDTILHQFVSFLAGMADSFSGATFCTAVFDEFFLVRCSPQIVQTPVLQCCFEFIF